MWSEKRSSLLCGVSFCSGREYWIFWPGRMVKREAGTAAYSDAFPSGHFQGTHAQRTPQQASGLGLPLQFSPLWCNHLQTCKQEGQHSSYVPLKVKCNLKSSSISHSQNSNVNAAWGTKSDEKCRQLCGVSEKKISTCSLDAGRCPDTWIAHWPLSPFEYTRLHILPCCKAEVSPSAPQAAAKGRAYKQSLASSAGRHKSQSTIQLGCYLPVRCEHHWSPLFDYTQSTVPQETTCFGIHPCCWLILQNINKNRLHYYILLTNTSSLKWPVQPGYAYWKCWK